MADTDDWGGIPVDQSQPDDWGGIPLSETKPPPPTGRERQHSYLESLRAGSPETPAGQAAPGPDLSGEQRTGGQLAHEYGQIGKGMAKGIPALTGIPGDIESMALGAINSLSTPGKPLVGPQTIMPTTTEGGIFGPKIMGKNALINPAANPLEATGMQIPSMLLPGLKGLRGAKAVVPERLPPAPPGGSMATVREGSGARLLPPEVPHVAPVASGSRDLGAAGSAGGPLEGVSPETITQMRKVFSEEGVTPYTVDQRLEEMSPHQFLGEFSPNTEAHMGAAAAPPGQAKLEIVNSVGQRAKEAKDRLRSTFDTYFGETENLAQLKRTREIDQNKAATPLYKAFKSLPIPPTEELQALIPRLEQVGAFSEARAFAAAKGIPWKEDAFTAGPMQDALRPTAESWDLVKQALDSKIEQSFKDGRPTKWTGIYVGMKNELVNAIDNHPNPQVAGVWKQARQAYAGPAQIADAEKLGRKIFTLDHDELPFLTAGYSDGQMAAFRSSVRKELENRLGKPGKTELRTVNEILAENNQQKFRWILGDEATDNLVKSVEHEFNMHGAPTRIHGGSPTAFRTEAQKMWTPQGPSGLETAGNIADAGLGLITHPTGTLIRGARKLGITKMDTAREAAAAKIRDEAARIFTLQGPERDSVIRYLANPETPRATGGAVVPKHRATGGRAVGHKPSRPLMKDARKAPDGRYYIPDPKRHGKFLRVDP